MADWARIIKNQTNKCDMCQEMQSKTDFATFSLHLKGRNAVIVTICEKCITACYSLMNPPKERKKRSKRVDNPSTVGYTENILEKEADTNV